MKLHRQGKTSATEVHVSDDIQILFSYETPVAAWVSGRGLLRTDRKYSVTTSRHINRWLDGRTATTIPQAELDLLATK